MNLIAPRTDILPPAQKDLWPALRILEHGFVLYGGTAIALRYGHRQSIDFDFFGVQFFDPDVFKEKYEFLKKHSSFTRKGRRFFRTMLDFDALRPIRLVELRIKMLDLASTRS